MIVVILVAVFAVGLGIGVAVTHATMADKVSSARDAGKRAQQTADDLQRRAAVNRALALRNMQTAEVEQRLAAAQAERISQQAAWMRACDNLYAGAQASAVRLSCIDAVRNGVSPKTFQRNHAA